MKKNTDIPNENTDDGSEENNVETFNDVPTRNSDDDDGVASNGKEDDISVSGKRSEISSGEDDNGQHVSEECETDYRDKETPTREKKKIRRVNVNFVSTPSPPVPHTKCRVDKYRLRKGQFRRLKNQQNRWTRQSQNI